MQPGHVALIEKTTGQGHFAQWRTVEGQASGFAQAALDDVAIGAGAVQRPEVPGQTPSVPAACLHQIVQGDHLVEGIVDEQAGTFCRRVVDQPPSAPVARRNVEGLGHIVDGVLFLQRVEGMIQAVQQSTGRDVEARIAGQSTFDERQRLAPQHLLDHRRFYVEHPVAKAIAGPRFAIVHLVRVQDDGAAGLAMTLAVAIVEALDARKRDADGVGVMAMSGVAVPTEVSLDAFHFPRFGCPHQPVAVVDGSSHCTGLLFSSVYPTCLATIVTAKSRTGVGAVECNEAAILPQALGSQAKEQDQKIPGFASAYRPRLALFRFLLRASRHGRS